MVAFLTLAASFVLVAPAVLAEPLSPGALYSCQLSGFNPSEIPQACVQTCTDIENTLGTGDCTQLSCLCTAAVDNRIRSCLNCAVQANVPDVNATSVDQIVSGFEEACREGGFPISGTSTTSPTSGTTGSGTTGSGTSGSGTTGSGSSGSATTSGSSSASTTSAASGNPLTGNQKSGAIADYSISIVASVFALAMSGFALL